MSQGHHAQSHSKRWKQEEIAPVTPLTFLFSEASRVSPLREAAVYHYRSGMEAKEATTLCFSLNRDGRDGLFYRKALSGHTII